MSGDVISDDVWAVIGPLFPKAKSTGRPPVDRRAVVEATAWRFRTGAPWRDVPERFGNWNTLYKNFNLWAKQGGVCSSRSSLSPSSAATWTGSHRSTPRSCASISTVRPARESRGLHRITRSNANATTAGTSSSGASTSSSSGAGSRCARTRPPATTTPASVSRPRSTGSPAASHLGAAELPTGEPRGRRPAP